LSYPAHS